MRTHLYVLTALVAGLLVVGIASGSPQPAAETGVEVLGPEICSACHESQVEAFQTNPHMVLGTEGWGDEGMAPGLCGSCHGDATAHVDEGGGQGNIFSFGGTSLANTEACQSCHGNVHPGFQRTAHAAAGMSCTSCHSIHSESAIPAVALLKSGQADPHGTDRIGMNRMGTVTATCVECHQATFTEFEFNERHRLQEGILDCASCHDPHEPQARVALGGFSQQACIDCHTDKGGPFVFEHGGQRIEGCVACHTPHGSPNRHMLKFQRVGALCYSCHTQVPGFHSRFTLDSNCTNCHSSIHGSNFDPYFLK